MTWQVMYLLIAVWTLLGGSIYSIRKGMNVWASILVSGLCGIGWPVIFVAVLVACINQPITKEA